MAILAGLLAVALAVVCVIKLFTAGADRGIPEGRSDGAELELADREVAAVADRDGTSGAWFDPHLFI